MSGQETAQTILTGSPGTWDPTLQGRMSSQLRIQCIEQGLCFFQIRRHAPVGAFGAVEAASREPHPLDRAPCLP